MEVPIRALAPSAADAVQASVRVPSLVDCVEELLRNAAEAGASTVSATVHAQEGAVCVADDGRGMDRIGLCAIHNRRSALWAIAALGTLRVRCRIDGSGVEWDGKVVRACPNAPRRGVEVEVRDLFAALPARAALARADRTARQRVLRACALVAYAHSGLTVEVAWEDGGGAKPATVRAAGREGAFRLLRGGGGSHPLCSCRAGSSPVPLPAPSLAVPGRAHEGVVLHGHFVLWSGPPKGSALASRCTSRVHLLAGAGLRAVEAGSDEEATLRAAVASALAATLPGAAPAEKTRRIVHAEGVVVASLAPAWGATVRSGAKMVIHAPRAGAWTSACARLARDAADRLGSALAAVSPAAVRRPVAPSRARRARGRQDGVAVALPAREPADSCVTRALLARSRVVGQVDRKFIVLHGDQGGAVVDQHAADERVRYESLRDRVCAGVAAWRCGHAHDGEAFAVVAVEPALVLEAGGLAEAALRHAGELALWGFLQRPRRGGGASARALAFTSSLAASGGARGPAGAEFTHLPAVAGQSLSVQHLYSVLEELEEPGSGIATPAAPVARLPRCFADVAKSRACRGAIMFGDSLDHAQCAALVRSLSQCRNPFACAHGRPTVSRVAVLEGR